MSNIVAPANAKSAQIEMIVTRANGTVENLGVVSYWHRNPLKRLAWRVKNYFKRN